MKVIITINRITEYSSIVEIDRATYDRINKDLDGGRMEINRANKELNRMIDVKDWQDDEFHSLEEFRPFLETENK